MFNESGKTKNKQSLIDKLLLAYSLLLSFTPSLVCYFPLSHSVTLDGHLGKLIVAKGFKKLPKVE